MLKPIKGLEDLYMVSDNGYVWSNRQNRFLKSFPNSRGYMRVNLVDAEGNKLKPFLHRLVAEAFCEHPDGCDVVNHLDFNYQNNCADNLEWTTTKKNMEYSAKAGRMKINPDRLQRIIEGQKRKKVVGKSLADGKTIILNGVNESKKHGFQPTCVSLCCNGKRESHAGYKWSFL